MQINKGQKIAMAVIAQLFVLAVLIPPRRGANLAFTS